MGAKRLLWALLALVGTQAWAAGPASIAMSDRSLWPTPIDSVAGYNRASRAEILVFAGALGELTAQDEAALKTGLRIKSVDKASVQRLRERLLRRLLDNLAAARASCVSGELLCEPVTTVPTLMEASRKLADRMPEPYRAWLDNAAAFHRIYAAELVRLAALFPNVSSEIDTFGPSERSGFELPDGHFLWTFDDGPTASGGTTDALLSILDNTPIHGMFYVLGERVKKRVQATPASALQKMYSGQCLALHGWVHESHQKMEQWQSSVVDTQQLVRETWPGAYRPYFRPPYGQRRSDSTPFFAANNLTVALWNIDSQDWNAKVSERDAAQRVLTLMLLWRSGVILFHDVHAKAAYAVPWILEQTRRSGIAWDDCHSY